jgi:hypothetical protein
MTLADAAGMAALQWEQSTSVRIDELRRDDP